MIQIQELSEENRRIRKENSSLDGKVIAQISSQDSGDLKQRQQISYFNKLVETLKIACDIGTSQSKKLSDSIDSILQSVHSLNPAAAASFSLEKDILNFGISLQEMIKHQVRNPPQSSNNSRVESDFQRLSLFNEQQFSSDSLIRPSSTKPMNLSKKGAPVLSRHPPQVNHIEAGYRIPRISSASGPDVKDLSAFPAEKYASSKEFTNIKLKISELKSRAVTDLFSKD